MGLRGRGYTFYSECDEGYRTPEYRQGVIHDRGYQDLCHRVRRKAPHGPAGPLGRAFDDERREHKYCSKDDGASEEHGLRLAGLLRDMGAGTEPGGGDRKRTALLPDP